MKKIGKSLLESVRGQFSFCLPVICGMFVLYPVIIDQLKQKIALYLAHSGLSVSLSLTNLR